MIKDLEFVKFEFEKEKDRVNGDLKIRFLSFRNLCELQSQPPSLSVSTSPSFSLLCKIEPTSIVAQTSTIALYLALLPSSSKTAARLALSYIVGLLVLGFFFEILEIYIGIRPNLCLPVMLGSYIQVFEGL